MLKLWDDLLHIYFSPDDGSGGGDEDDDSADDEEGEEDEEDSKDEDDSEDEDADKSSDEDEDDDEEFDKDRAMKTIHRQRKIEKDQKQELKVLRKFKSDAEAKTKKKEDADKSELQRETERADTAEETSSELEDDLRTERISRAIEREALKLGFIDPQDAHSLIEAKGVKYDAETGSVSGHVKLLEALKEEKPYLLSEEGPPGTPPRKKGKVGGKKSKDLEKQSAQEALGVSVKL